MKYSSALILLLTWTILLSCSEPQEKQEIPEDVLSEEVFSDILVDFMIIDSYKKRMSVGNNTDSLRSEVRSYYRDILDKYKCTKEEYDHSFDYYNADPSRMMTIFDKAELKLKMTEDTISFKGKKDATIDDKIRKNIPKILGK